MGPMDRRCFLSFLFPFPLSSHWALSTERAAGPSSCSMHSWADPYSPPSPSTSFAKKRSVLAHCRPTGNIPSLHSLFCIPIHSLSGTKMDGSRVSWNAMQKSFLKKFFFGYACPIRCTLKGRGKREITHTDTTSIVIILKSMSDSLNIWIPMRFFLLSCPCFLACWTLCENIEGPLYFILLQRIKTGGRSS